MMPPESPQFSPDETGEEPEPSPAMQGRAPDRVDYNVRLSEMARKKLAARVVQEWQRYDSITESKRNLIKELRKDWEMVPLGGGGPWDGSSEVRAPHTRLGCDQHELRLNTLITGPELPFSAKARNPEVIPNLSRIEEALSAILEEADWKTKAREVHREIQIAPLLFRVTYERETRMVPRLLVDVEEKTLKSYQEAGVEPGQAMLAAAKRDAQGELAIELEWEELTTFDGVKMEVIPWEDMVVLPVNAQSEDTLWGLGERVRLRGIDLKQGKDAGKYLEDAVDRLLKHPGDGLDEDDIEDAEDFSAVDLEGGNYEEANYREYDCLDLCWLDDLDGSGYLKWYCLTVHLETETLLRVQYSPYEHGRPYYVLFNYLPRSRQIFGQSMAELLATTQSGASATINNFHDLVTMLVNMAGSYFHDEDAELDTDRIEYSPGKPIKCRDPQRNIMPMVQAAGIGPALEACLRGIEHYKQTADLLAAVSNPTMGVGTEDTTTATEVKVVAGNADARFENQAAGVALQWKKVWDLVRWTAAQYAEAGTVRYRKAAAPGQDDQFLEVASEVLKADVDLVPTALNEWSNPQTRVARDQFALGIVSSDPILANDLNLKVTLLEALFNDIRHPQAQQIIQMVKAAYAQYQMMQQAMALMQGATAAAGAAQQQQQAEAEGQRSQEQHELSQAQGQMGILQQAQQMAQPPALPNGKR